MANAESIWMLFLFIQGIILGFLISLSVVEFGGRDNKAIKELKEELDNKIADIWMCPHCKTPLVLKDMKKRIFEIIDEWSG